MRFPNAYNGVKKIFSAEILHLVAVILMAVGLVTAVIAGVVGTAVGDAAELTEGEFVVTVGGIIGAVSILAVGGILALIAFILQIVGVGQAMKDESYFKTAFIFIFVGIACTVLSCIPDTVLTDFFISLFRTLGQISQLLVTIYIIGGIQRLASKMGNIDLERKGSTIFTLITIFYCVAIIVCIVSLFATLLAEIFAICALVIDLVTYIIFLSYLAQAKKMLAE
ncbi:MAG: hypothetical protein IJJ15_06125 [Ruminococcus sp.]|nr:hypothetical protein [Ruminococcus sp.]